MGLRTIILKLHKPGRSKSRILDEALLNYNKAYQFLLYRASLELEVIRARYGNDKGKYRAGELSKWVDGELGRELNRYNVQPFKDSLRMELGMVLASYLSLEAIKAKVTFPKVQDFSNPENKPLRPLYFCRYATNRSYCLLYDNEKSRYYVKLYLMNSGCSRLAAPRNNTGGLTYIHKDKIPFTADRKKEAFIIVPLSFGRYQEAFLKEALERPEILRTAKLYREGKEYYLAVSVETDNGPGINTTTFLGIVRGLKSSLNYTVVDGKGYLLNSGAILPNFSNTAVDEIPLNELHKAANTISGIALKNRSQVIMQNLNEKGDGISRTGPDGVIRRPVYKCREYLRLIGLLEYKLPEKGLPAPVTVSSVDVFYRCPECGHGSKRNRLAGNIFICTKCGTTMDMENLGSLNLARKLVRYGCSKIRIKVARTAEGVQFTNKLIGLNCFIMHSGNQLEKLRSEIQGAFDGIRNELEKGLPGKETAKKASILRKVDNMPDFMDFIEFV